MSAAHVPVLLAEVTAALAPRDGAILVDGTFGRGGYAEALLARYLRLGMQVALAGNDLPLLLGAATQRAKAMRDLTA